MCRVPVTGADTVENREHGPVLQQGAAEGKDSHTAQRDPAQLASGDSALAQGWILAFTGARRPQPHQKSRHEGVNLMGSCHV